MLIRSRANVFTAQGCRSVLKKAGKSLNGKNAVQNARTSKAIYAAALASPVLATPLTRPVGVEIAGARLLMNQDGTINVQSGATEIGRGADTVFSQMVAKTVGGSGQRRSRYFNTRYRRYAVRSRCICLAPELCCRARAAQCGTVIKKRKSSLTPLSCYISQR